MAQGALQVWKKSSLLRRSQYIWLARYFLLSYKRHCSSSRHNCSRGENTRPAAFVTANIHALELGMTFVQKWLPSDNLTYYDLF